MHHSRVVVSRVDCSHTSFQRAPRSGGLSCPTVSTRCPSPSPSSPSLSLESSGSHLFTPPRRALSKSSASRLLRIPLLPSRRTFKSTLIGRSRSHRLQIRRSVCSEDGADRSLARSRFQMQIRGSHLLHLGLTLRERRFESICHTTFWRPTPRPFEAPGSRGISGPQ